MNINRWIQTKDELPCDLAKVEFHVMHKSGEEEMLEGQYQKRRGSCFVIDGGFWFQTDIVKQWRLLDEEK